MIDFHMHHELLANASIIMAYNGPLWSHELYGITEKLRHHLSLDTQPTAAATSLFAVFVEQLNNMIMYSAEKMRGIYPDGTTFEASKGSFILSRGNEAYSLQTGNAVTKETAVDLEKRLADLNSLDKKELFASYKKQLKAKRMRDKKGAGVGLFEIAWRATSKIKYEFSPREDGMMYFCMQIDI